MDSRIHRSRRPEIDEAGVMSIKSKNIKELRRDFRKIRSRVVLLSQPRLTSRAHFVGKRNVRAFACTTPVQCFPKMVLNSCG
jgi:hypothetical protein